MPQSKSDTHLTPDRVFDMIDEHYEINRELFFDPCPANTPYKSPCFFNGLYGKWSEYNFVNPPYSNGKIQAFVEKAIDQLSKHGCKTVMLLPSKTDQSFFHILTRWHIYIVWIHRRLKFKNNKHYATQPHFLVMIQ